MTQSERGLYSLRQAAIRLRIMLSYDKATYLTRRRTRAGVLSKLSASMRDTCRYKGRSRKTCRSLAGRMMRGFTSEYVDVDTPT